MTVECVIEDPRWNEIGLDRLANNVVQTTLNYLELQGFDTCILWCSDVRIATLNSDFRGKPFATNVLSWPSGDRGALADGDMPFPPDRTDPELGDIAISYDTCVAETMSGGKTMDEHTTHLIVHGLLHLLGYDHERDADAILMEGVETQILGKLGIADPYAH